MKVKSECIPCLIDRAKFEVDLVFNNEEDKISTLIEILHKISEEININSVPATLGTLRERIIKKRSGMYDPYKELKQKDIQIAKKLLPVAVNYYKERKSMESLIRIAAASNSMEYGVRGHDFDPEKFKNRFLDILEEELYGNPEEVENALSRYEKILYLLDNAGEAVFDILIAKELKKMGKEVLLCPKSEPIINDITIQELKEMVREFKCIPSGPCIGVVLEEAEEEFKKILFNKKYLILAKGMGHYETISEFHDKLKGRIIHIFRAKCESVAGEVGVKRGSLVVELVI